MRVLCLESIEGVASCQMRVEALKSSQTLTNILEHFLKVDHVLVCDVLPLIVFKIHSFYSNVYVLPLIVFKIHSFYSNVYASKGGTSLICFNSRVHIFFVATGHF